MGPETTRARYGVPQIFAAALLLLFLAQCAWFVSRVPLNHMEASYIARGIAMVHGIREVEPFHSPLVSDAAVVGVLPVLLHAPPDAPLIDQITLDHYRWLVRAPFLLAGLLLGASVWYVARRLYGNAGGYVAIGLYCFTPALVACSSLAGPEILGAWGAFGVVFTAIAVAHTLYAPRNFLLWNGKRIALLGVAICVMVGTQYSLVWILPLALAFMLWAVPERALAALGILATAMAVALMFLVIVHAASVHFLWRSLAAARWGAFSPSGSVATLPSLFGGFYLREAPAVGLLAIIALFAYLAWPRARFFGNTVPLLVSLEMILLAILMPAAAGGVFFFYCLPFFIIFSAGVFADLFECRYQGAAVGVAYGVILAQAGLSLVGLLLLTRGLH